MDAYFKHFFYSSLWPVSYLTPTRVQVFTLLSLLFCEKVWGREVSTFFVLKQSWPMRTIPVQILTCAMNTTGSVTALRQQFSRERSRLPSIFIYLLHLFVCFLNNLFSTTFILCYVKRRLKKKNDRKISSLRNKKDDFCLYTVLGRERVD